MPDSRSFFLGSDVGRLRLPGGEAGVEIAVLDWGGAGPIALLHHANGFCGALWEPVAERLRDRFRVFAIDARGHGDSTPGPAALGDEAYAWARMRDDLVAVARGLLERTDQSRIALAAGHSFGGLLSMAAAAQVPGLIDRVFAIDPVLLPRMTPAERAARNEKFQLIESARRRRAHFPDREAARAHFASRDLFSRWQPRALDLYVGEALRDAADGGVELKCPGTVEAAIFSNGGVLDPFDALEGCATPAHLLWASGGNFPLETFQAIASRMQDAEVEACDCGHLVLMEEPGRVVTSLERFIGADRVDRAVHG